MIKCSICYILTHIELTTKLTGYIKLNQISIISNKNPVIPNSEQIYQTIKLILTTTSPKKKKNSKKLGKTISPRQEWNKHGWNLKYENKKWKWKWKFSPWQEGNTRNLSVCVNVWSQLEKAENKTKNMNGVALELKFSNMFFRILNRAKLQKWVCRDSM